MPDIWIKIIVAVAGAVASFLFGAFLTRWWNRARPLVLLHGFTGIIAKKQKVDCPPELEALTDLSWHVPRFSKGQNSVGDISNAVDIASVVGRRYEAAQELLAKIIERLRSAATPAEITSALREAMANWSISDALDNALLLEDIVVAPIDMQNLTAQISIYESEDDDGCFRIAWKGATTKFSGDLKGKPYKSVLLKPFLDSIRYLHKSSLLTTFSALPPLIEKQIKLHQKTLGLTKPIAEQNGRWAGKMLIANYGSAPMLIWPDARLHVKHKQSKARFVVNCYMAKEFDQSPKLRDIEGLVVLGPGEKVWCWAITREVQGGIKDGAVLRTHYLQKDAVSNIRLHITRRGSFWTDYIFSNKMPFQQSGVDISEE
jgi:hypothetical protein